MKYLARFVLAAVVACNSVTVVPIDDEDAGDAGDAGSEASTPTNDAAANDAPSDAGNGD